MQVAEQTYPLHKIEVVVVEDNVISVEADIRKLNAVRLLDVVNTTAQRPVNQTHSCSQAPDAAGLSLCVRLVRLQERASIGVKRNLALSAASGEVIIHWDDDDLHHPDRVSKQVAPIVSGTASVTMLELSSYGVLEQDPDGSHNGSGVLFYGPSTAQGLPFFGSLAYLRGAAMAINGFLDESLGEDVYLTLTLLNRCE